MCNFSFESTPYHCLRIKHPCYPVLVFLPLLGLVLRVLSHGSEPPTLDTLWVGGLCFLIPAWIFSQSTPDAEFIFDTEENQLKKRYSYWGSERIKKVVPLSELAAVTVSACSWRGSEYVGCGGTPQGYVTAAFLVTRSGRRIRVSDYSNWCWTGYAQACEIAKETAERLRLPYQPGPEATRVVTSRGSRPEEPNLAFKELRYAPTPVHALFALLMVVCAALAGTVMLWLMTLPTLWLFIPVPIKIQPPHSQRALGQAVHTTFTSR